MNTKPQFNSTSVGKSLWVNDKFKELCKKIDGGEKDLYISGLRGSSKFFLVHALWLKIQRPVLFVSPTAKKARAASRDFSFFLNKTPPVLLKREFGSAESLFSSNTRSSSARIHWLNSALQGGLVIAEESALYEKTVPKKIFEHSVISIEKGNILYREELIEGLIQSGYTRTDFVQKEGELGERGSIVDIFSPGQDSPVRIEFIGDEIGSIRLFNPEDQKSRDKIETVTILPGSEVILNADSIKRAVRYLKHKAGEEGITARNKLALTEEIGKGNRLANIEWLLPAFYKPPGSIFEYLPESTIIVTEDEDESPRAAEEYMKARNKTEPLIKRHLKVAPGAGELFFNLSEIDKERAGYQQIFLRELNIEETGFKSIEFNGERVFIEAARGTDSPLDALSEEIEGCRQKGYSLHLSFQTATEREKLVNILKGRGITEVNAHVSELSHGFRLPEAKIEVLTEWDILGEKKERGTRKKGADVPSAFITSFSELKPGDYIVHVDFGVGIFRSLKRLKIGDSEGDFIQCEYAGGDKIYVPIDRLKLVQRYIGDGKKPKVDRLGTQSWNTRVRKVRKAVENVARELLELYARRKAMKGYAFTPGDEQFREFELAFTYEETPDQEAAIEEVIRDMEASTPMDRLICGDVGFGKTEVALRAAFKAVSDGKQVAFLVPTTLLAQQHYKTSLARLKDYPLVIESLSRFKTGKQAAGIFSKLENGKIDIIIGTHKLLGEKIKFKDLGLVIIDEEHRFGVSQKEKLRKIREGVDTVSMSATPIPRTLQLSLAKIRDISLINTPPEGRQAIETYVYQSTPDIIKEAVTREIDRKGSVYFIHNRIEDIHRVAERLQKLFPGARIEVTHGRMREKALEKTITKFIEGDLDILVTTAIVESGLDIPRANTIIIDDAHTFGLADLYQLRGRVGRSEKKAYAYLLIPSRSSLSPEARRRLRAISDLKELGSGYKLALSDLEIRGAGHLFGTEQSGHIADVGIELYLDMLEGAVRRLEGKKVKEEIETDISVSSPAFIPDDYISNDTERLLFYKRLSAVNDEDSLREITSELRDRFGEIPGPAASLVELIELKIMMKKLLIKKAEIGSKKAVITFSENSPLYAKYPRSGRTEIYFEAQEPLAEIKRIIHKLGRTQKEKRPER
ncbi:MAG: transcription-repair coupling factor [Deltaproteobacteria bacterium]